jgi:signal transduction histidine kinase
MKEVIFEKSPNLDASQKRLADLHSLFNVLNVLCGEFCLLETYAPDRESELTALGDEIASIAQELREGDDVFHALARLRDSENTVIRCLSSIYESIESGVNRDELGKSISNLKLIYEIVVIRLQELEVRAQDPDVWVTIDVNDFEKRFQDVFSAIEKNAKGRYRIFFNLARKNTGDYYIDLKIESAREFSKLWIPLRLIDVLRDLTANARKYTLPGGKVALALYQDDEKITCIIEDNGCGIPGDEIEKVVEFGYRASNVRSRPTMGGGFGLTKAAWLICEWGGKLSITSELNKGTRISISLPVKAPETSARSHEFVI